MELKLKYFIAFKDESGKMLENIANYNISRFVILTPEDVYTFGDFVEVNNYICSNNYFNVEHKLLYNNYLKKDHFENLKECDMCGFYSENVKKVDGFNLCEFCREDYKNYIY